MQVDELSAYVGSNVQVKIAARGTALVLTITNYGRLWTSPRQTVAAAKGLAVIAWNWATKSVRDPARLVEVVAAITIALQNFIDAGPA